MNQYLKKIIILFFISLLFTQCIKEEISEKHIEESEYKITALQNYEYLKNKELSNRLELIQEQINPVEKTKSGGIYSNTHNFYINTDNVTYVENESNSYHSYTFHVSRSDNPEVLENLVFSLKPDGTYKIVLVEYNLDQTEKMLYFLGEEIDFEGKVSSREIEDGDLSSLLLKNATPNCLWVVRTWCAGDNHEGGYVNGVECPAHRSQIEYYCFGGSGSDGGSTFNGGDTGTSPNTSTSASGGGSISNEFNDVTTPNCTTCVPYSYSGMMLELELRKIMAADIEIPDPYLIDLNSFLKEGQLVSWDMAGGFCYKFKGHFIYVRNGKYYGYDTGLSDWVRVVPSTNSLSAELTRLLGGAVTEAAQFMGSYILPVEDFYILMTGNDFSGFKSNQYATGGFLLLGAIPGTKFLKPVANVMGDATKYFFKYGDNLLGLVKVNGVVKFADSTVQKLAKAATKNADKTKVMLGKYDGGGTSGYVSRAGTDYTYFDIGEDAWSNLESLVNKNSDEMWKINKQFIDNQKSLNREFYFSHDPKFATGTYLREINYLTNDLKGNVVPINSNTWKIQW